MSAAGILVLFSYNKEKTQACLPVHLLHMLLSHLGRYNCSLSKFIHLVQQLLGHMGISLKRYMHFFGLAWINIHIVEARPWGGRVDRCLESMSVSWTANMVNRGVILVFVVQSVKSSLMRHKKYSTHSIVPRGTAPEISNQSEIVSPWGNYLIGKPQHFSEDRLEYPRHEALQVRYWDLHDQRP